MENFFPHDKFLDGTFHQHIPLFSTSASIQKILLKTPVQFPITITICKHWSKFLTCNPFHGDCEGASRPQMFSNTLIKVLWYGESDGVIFVKILWLLGDVSPYFLK